MNNPVSQQEIWFWTGLLVLAALAVILYNSWALCCGHCTLSDLLHIPWWGLLLLAANLAAGLTLVMISRKRGRSKSRHHCSGCCSAADPGWIYCPLCGCEQTGR